MTWKYKIKVEQASPTRQYYMLLYRTIKGKYSEEIAARLGRFTGSINVICLSTSEAGFCKRYDDDDQAGLFKI